MKNEFLKFVFIVIGINFISCSNEINTKSYYVKKPFIKNESFEFISRDSNESEFWEVSRDKENGIIKTKRLNSKGFLLDEITEKITENGSEFISYLFVDKTGEFPTNLEFHPKEKDLILWDLNKISVYSGEYIQNGIIFEIMRKRKFLKKENENLIFKEKYEIKPIDGQFISNENWIYKMNFSQTSYFEKNKGLVKYERIYRNGESELFEREK